MKEKILSRAIALFNDQGVEYVGVRELAADMGIKGGNITYYFPTKNHLVQAVAQRLTESNSELFSAAPGPGLRGTLDRFIRIYENQYRFRSLFLSLNHLLQHNPLMAENFYLNQQNRRSWIHGDLKRLVAEKHLHAPKAEAAIGELVLVISLVSRFWISDASILFPEGDFRQKVVPYARGLATVYEPYATAKGKKDIQGFLEELG